MKQQPEIAAPFDDSHVLNNLPAAVSVYDMDGIIRKYNEQAARLWGRRPKLGDANERFSGSYRLYQLDGAFLPHDQAPVAECLKDGLPKKDLEFILERPDLSRIYVRVDIIPVIGDGGKQVGVINCFFDITHQKESEQELTRKIREEKLRELAASLETLVEKKTRDLLVRTEELKKSEERYHKMVEEVEDYAILLLNKEGNIMNWNKGAEKIKGYKEEEIVGKNFQEFYLPEDRQKALPLQLLQQAREEGKALHEGWRKRKDGSAFWGSIVLTAIHGDEGNLIGFTKVTRDLTERKLAEDRMKEYLSQLEFQNKELEQFVYAASHDLKEPLRKINLYINYIADQPANQLDDKSRDYINRSVKAAERMKALIEDLLIYSRSTFNAGNFENVDLNKVVEEVIHEVGEEKGKIMAGQLPVVRGVPFQLKQVFFNLVNNSINYKHPDRDVTINIRYELVNGEYIWAPGLDKNKLYYKISVVDNGIGFEQAYAGKIFEIFQRLNNSGSAKGSGIGLSIVKKIIQNYKGAIEATGEPGTGASFFIYLPKD